MKGRGGLNPETDRLSFEGEEEGEGGGGNQSDWRMKQEAKGQREGGMERNIQRDERSEGDRE